MSGRCIGSIKSPLCILSVPPVLIEAESSELRSSKVELLWAVWRLHLSRSVVRPPTQATLNPESLSGSEGDPRDEPTHPRQTPPQEPKALPSLAQAVDERQEVLKDARGLRAVEGLGFRV